MKAKLIKNTVGEYQLIVDKVISNSIDFFKLSIINCQAIERGYDLDEEVSNIVKTIVPDDRGKDIWYGTSMAVGKQCFKKALEILGDKKFSEEDIKEAYLSGVDDAMDIKYDSNATIDDEKHLKSLQQTEWDVEVEMECVMGCQNLILNGENSVCCGDKKPKLDADGCLILKTVKSE